MKPHLSLIQSLHQPYFIFHMPKVNLSKSDVVSHIMEFSFNFCCNPQLKEWRCHSCRTVLAIKYGSKNEPFTTKLVISSITNLPPKSYNTSKSAKKCNQIKIFQRDYISSEQIKKWQRFFIVEIPFYSLISRNARFVFVKCLWEFFAGQCKDQKQPFSDI